MPKKQYPLRLDPELYAILERWAADELRSVNAHIEFLLRDAARRAGRLPKAGPATAAGPRVRDDVAQGPGNVQAEGSTQSPESSGSPEASRPSTTDGE